MDFNDEIFADNLIPVFSEKGLKNYIIFSTPLPCGHFPSISLQKHPAILRDTSGGEVI